MYVANNAPAAISEPTTNVKFSARVFNIGVRKVMGPIRLANIAVPKSFIALDTRLASLTCDFVSSNDTAAALLSKSICC